MYHKIEYDYYLPLLVITGNITSKGPGGRLCSSKGGACAMAQWHNGQSKPAPDPLAAIRGELLLRGEKGGEGKGTGNLPVPFPSPP